jgi:hypothetical protein
LNFNSTYLFPLKGNKIQSIDWWQLKLHW